MYSTAEGFFNDYATVQHKRILDPLLYFTCISGTYTYLPQYRDEYLLIYTYIYTEDASKYILLYCTVLHLYRIPYYYYYYSALPYVNQ